MTAQPQPSYESQLAHSFQKTERWRRVGKAIAYLVLTAWAVVSLLPMYFTFVMSFQEIGLSLTIRDIKFFPTDPSLENFRELFQLDAPFWLEKRPVIRWFFNSALVAIIPTISNLVFDSMGGYALAKLRFPGRNFIFLSIVATMMIPSFVTFIPLYRMMFEFSWMDTYWALLFPGFAGVGGIFLMKQNIQTLPTSVLEAARIDACSEFRIFWKVVLPTAKPILAIIGITSFMGGWNSYFWPYLVAESKKMLTLQAGLSSLMGAGISGMPPSLSDYGIVMAAAVISAIPMIIVFFIFQKYVVQGITVGAVKG